MQGSPRGYARVSDGEQRAEGGVAGFAAIETEHEFVEVGLQVLAATQAVVDAERPTFEVGEEAMRPGKDDMGGHGSDDMRRVADVGCAGIALHPSAPPVTTSRM